MGKKVSYAKLQTAGFIPGIGEIPITLPPVNKTWHGFHMEYDLSGLTLEISGTQALIPPGNIVEVVFEKAAAQKVSK